MTRHKKWAQGSRWKFQQLNIDDKNVLLIQAVLTEKNGWIEFSSIEHINQALPKLLRGALSAFDNIVVRDSTGATGVAKIGHRAIQGILWALRE